MTSGHAIILGGGSDIGQGVAKRLKADGWSVASYAHDCTNLCFERTLWDLIVCCYGMMEPIGNFFEVGQGDWEHCVFSNIILPLRHVRTLYPYRTSMGVNPSVCFFSGAGTSGPAPTYSAYCASKVMLVKMTELLDDESPDCKFFILGPGVVRTKIHQQTINAGNSAANLERVENIVSGSEQGTSMDDVYACLMACHNASKAAVGGRNIYVPGDDWTRLEELIGKPDLLKLRRHGDQYLQRYSSVSETSPKVIYGVRSKPEKPCVALAKDIVPDDFAARLFKVDDGKRCTIHSVESVQDLGDTVVLSLSKGKEVK